MTEPLGDPQFETYDEYEQYQIDLGNLALQLEDLEEMFDRAFL